MMEALQFDFMRNALIAGLLVSIAGGVIGSFVVVNRIVFITAGVSHAAYGVIGMGFFLGFNPILSAIVFSLAAALGMGTVQRMTRLRSYTVIGMMWAISMATGIIIIDLTGNHKVNLRSYLFGNILDVSTSYL